MNRLRAFYLISAGMNMFSPKGFDTIAGGATPGIDASAPSLSPKGAKEKNCIALSGLLGVEYAFRWFHHRLHSIAPVWAEHLFSIS